MSDILSPYLVAVIAGWVIAQGIKYLVVVIRTGKLVNIRQLYLSGNMPSAHTATVVALTTVVGFVNGIDSAIFGLSALFTSVVAYDAMMVRRSSGEQGVAIRLLIKEQRSAVKMPRAAKGHTPAEVAVGAMVGVLIGLVVFLATK